MTEEIEAIFNKENYPIKSLTDYIVNILSTKKEVSQDNYEVAKDFILKAIKPKNRIKY